MRPLITLDDEGKSLFGDWLCSRFFVTIVSYISLEEILKKLKKFLIDRIIIALYYMDNIIKNWEGSMLKETVKWFNKEKGFGVIIFSNTVIRE